MWGFINNRYFSINLTTLKRLKVSNLLSGRSQKNNFLIPKILADFIAAFFLFLISSSMFFTFLELSPSAIKHTKISFPFFFSLAIVPPQPITSSSGCAAKINIFFFFKFIQ